MQFNWFTFTAQIVNFLILVFLLKHFLFNRILKRMDERSQKIRDQLKNALKEKEEANQRKQTLDEKYQELEKQKGDILENAKKDVDKQKQKMLEEARQDVDHKHQLWLSALENEQQDLFEGFEKKTRQYLFQISNHILSGLVDSSLQKQMVDRFTDHFHQLPEEQKNLLDQAVTKTKRLVVETALPLTSDLQKRLVDLLPASSEQIDFQTRSDLVAGIRLRVNGYKMDWNINSSLQDLEATFLEELKHHSREIKQGMESHQKQLNEEKQQE